MARAAAGLLVWGLLLVAAFGVDHWVYEHVSGAVAERTGYKPWRFERPPGGRSTGVTEALDLFKRFGHAWFVAVVSATILVLAPVRARQVLWLWLCIGAAALVSEALLKPSVAKLRPDAPLTAAMASDLEARHGSGAVVVRDGQPCNRGWAVSRGAFAGYREGGALTFPSGHATLAFAFFVVLGAMFPRGRWWFLLLAAGTAASRVLMGEHFLSDVIAGAGVGYLCARLLLRLPRARSAFP